MKALRLDLSDFQRRFTIFFAWLTVNKGGHGNNEATNNSPEPSVRPVSSLLRRF